MAAWMTLRDFSLRQTLPFWSPGTLAPPPKKRQRMSELIQCQGNSLPFRLDMTP